MKRMLSAMAAVSLITAVIGCANPHYRRSAYRPTGSCAPGSECSASCDGGSCNYATDPDSGKECRERACRLCRRGPRGVEVDNPGPATGAVTYPYYTNRGPRDFLDRNPQSIGP